MRRKSSQTFLLNNIKKQTNKTMKLEHSFLKKLSFFIALIFISEFVISQEIMITGKITDINDGSPLIGVSVVVKGTTVGTSTDINGSYSIRASANSILVFSYMGYETIEQKVGGQTVLNIAMFEAQLSLEELIVIGYGTQKKSEKTGAVAHIKAEEMNQGVLTDAIQALQSKASGVMITKKGGDPNSGFSIKIRGAASLATSTSPLFVVDGVPGVDPTTIAPEDIESFNILKDASAAAIYGSRGANGVIIITTKRGDSMKGNQIDFNSYISTDFVANKLDLLTADQIRNYVSDNALSFVDGGGSVDWQDEIFRPGTSQSHNFGYSGGDKDGTYRVSLSHTDFKGVVIGTNKTRTLGRINIDKKAFNDKLTLQSGLSGTFEENNYIAYGGWGSNDILFQAYQRNPTDPLNDTDGNLYDTQRNFNYWNPVKLVDDIQNERSAKRYTGYMKADLEVFKGLTAGVNLAYTRDDSESFYFEPSTIRMGTSSGYGRRSYSNYDSKVLESTIRYSNVFNEIHSLEAIGGYSFQEDFYTGFSAQGQQPFLDYITSNDLAMFQTVNPGDIDSYKSSERLISFFTRAMYNYNSKYFLTASLRRDGSSRFGKNNEWGWFPSAQVMWNITSEEFMESIEFMNSLKLRFSYGITGRLPSSNYMGIRWYESAGTAVNPETGENTILFRFAHEANPDLKWEENTEMNVGLDFGFLKDRISGSVEYFIKQNTDLLGEYSVPVPPNRADRIWANVGQIDVKGFELFVQTYPVTMSNFDWKTSLVFSSYVQTTKKLSDEENNWNWSQLQEGWLSGPGLVGDRNWTQTVQPDYQIGTWYMPEFAGISQDGKFLFYTEAGGVTRDITQAERRVVGNAQPDFEFGWSNYFTFFKNWDLSFNIRGVYGYEVFNTTRLIFGNPIWLPNINVLQSALDEKEKGLNDNPKLSSYYLEDASFIRLDNLSFGYNLKNVAGIKNIRLYFASNNLFTLTKYTGVDPEISYDGLSFGLDQYNVYPKTRTFTFGINLTL
ncbi:MAG TPA: SusC/RagA family TonB-linked outer membrane protein [Tenuifilaceae bacterium]|nr:SusC/RagA family TonB-linked outer membrane protein [Tenuifilaceae bacterium]HPJ44643.1 SusC/RagA family TonB-linked outer membrane protein [Tenuifilaceae bacterium]